MRGCNRDQIARDFPSGEQAQSPAAAFIQTARGQIPPPALTSLGYPTEIHGLLRRIEIGKCSIRGDVEIGGQGG